MRYTYHVVTLNGHGVHGRDFKRCRDAKKYAASLAQADPDYFGPYEIERVEHVAEGNARRYQLRRRSRWVQWHPQQDATVRKPDWIYGVLA